MHLNLQSKAPYLTYAFILCIMFSFTLPCSSEEPTAKKPTMTKMNPKDFITKYENALASQDWEMVEPLIHPDCTVTFSDGSVHKKRAEVEKAFRRNFGLIKGEKYSISNVHWIIKTDDFAVFAFSFDWSGVINGKKLSGSGRGTSSLVRKDGMWLLVSEHLGPKAREK